MKQSRSSSQNWPEPPGDLHWKIFPLALTIGSQNKKAEERRDGGHRIFLIVGINTLLGCQVIVFLKRETLTSAVITMNICNAL